MHSCYLAFFNNLTPDTSSMMAEAIIKMPLILFCFCTGKESIALFAFFATIFEPAISAAETANPFADIIIIFELTPDAKYMPAGHQ